jgi:hypothetical protein
MTTRQLNRLFHEAADAAGIRMGGVLCQAAPGDCKIASLAPGIHGVAIAIQLDTRTPPFFAIGNNGSRS